MYRGYRFVIGAAFGCLCLAASPPSQGASGNQSAAEQSRRNDIARIATALEKLPQAQAPDTGCKAEQEDRSSDLCAQWKAADGAVGSAIWTEKTFWAGVVGLLIGGLTLFFASRAAHWAKEAATHTEAGAREAKRSADVADGSLRGWLSITVNTIGPVWRELEGSVMVATNCTLKNCGNAPINQISYGVRVYSVFDHSFAKADDIGSFLEGMRVSGLATLALAPGAEITLNTQNVVQPEHLQPIERDGVIGYHFHAWIGATCYTREKFATAFAIALINNMDRDGFPTIDSLWTADNVSFLQTGSNFT